MELLDLIAVAAWCFVAALAGGLVGLVLGNIRLPVILLAASSPAAGAGANIGISGVAASAASFAHVRSGRIDWRLFAVMTPPSVVGAIVGGYISGKLPRGLLLGIIAAVLLYFGFDLLRPKTSREASRRPSNDVGLNWAAAVVSGAVIGLLGGLVGLILGSLRMPAIIRYVGESPALAVGTNVTVGIFVGIAGVAGHVPAGVDWDLLAVGSGASIPGALLGARFTGRLSEQQLLRAIGAVLVVAGLAAAAQALR